MDERAHFAAVRGEQVRRLCVIALIALVPLVSVACVAEERNVLQEAEIRLNEGPLFAYADEHLSDEALEAAVPEPFEFLDVKRNGYDRHGNEWVTVGVRMDGPVRFARSIFYVHPDEAQAHEMFEDQSQEADFGGLGAVAKDPQAQPWSQEQLDVENRCSVRADYLFWCHAYKGRVYLVVQSSADWPRGRNVSPEERRGAKSLLNAFGRYLEQQVPDP